MKVARAAALAAAAWAFVSLAWVVAHRVAYPFDLEWHLGRDLNRAVRTHRDDPRFDVPPLAR